MKSKFFVLLAGSMLAVPVFAAETPNNSLPLKNVVLFSSGVGYFGRGGHVNGNAEVELKVRGPQVSDILKSLVLIDSKGSVKPVTYSIADWIKQRPREQDLPLDADASLGTVLQQFQGSHIRLEQREGAPVEGRILSVAKKTQLGKEGTKAPEFLTLVTPDGLSSFNLETVTKIRLLDAKLDAKLQGTLERRAEALTAQVDDQLRSINVRFSGAGERDVRAGYLLETPAWKTSYRLVLDDKKRALLQGWAVVENTTDEDWKDVRLSLVSGRPVSFIQNLYAPLYVGRPVVSVGLPGTSLEPQTFGEGFQTRTVTEESKPVAASEPEMNVPPPPPGAPAIAPYLPRRRQIFSNRGAYATAGAAPRDEIVDAVVVDGRVEAQAKGVEKGELFEYAIDEAVTLDRGMAAMVPIVSQDVSAEALTIVPSKQYVGPQEAANGLRLKNDSGLHLQGGAITVFADGIYAGDALITNIAPDESRLITYAQDFDSAVRLDQVQRDTIITGIGAEDGFLSVQQREEKTLVYLVKNKSDKNRTYMLQVPEDAGFKLKNPKQLYEKSNDGLRFKFDVPAGKSLTYTIESTSTGFDSLQISDISSDAIRMYSSEKISPAAKRAFAEILSRRNKIQQVHQRRANLQSSLHEIEVDQQRIRNNMKALSRESSLYKRYESKLFNQEPRIEKLHAEITALRTSEAQLRRGLQTYLAKLAF